MALDEEFIVSLKRGEDDAYELLVLRFETPLYKYFFGSHGDPQLAGEQTADCFSELVKSLPKMAGGANQLRPFVFAVAKNIVRRQWRRRMRDFSPLRSADDAVDHCPGPDTVVEAAEECARLIAAIRALDPATRDVFLLRFVDELPIVEVAEALGEPIGTIKSRLHRGRQRLQEILQTRSRLR